MRTLMILGASVYQVPLIKTAKRMGLRVIVSSIPGNYPGFAYADKVYYTNTVDKESILEIARAEKIDGICTTGTDVAVITIGYVNEHMGLHGISEAAAVRATDKALMKDAFAKASVSASEFIKVSSYDEAVSAADKIGLPVIVKCVDSSGNRGISKVNDISELKAAYEDACRYSRKDYVLVEEMLKGIEIGIDGMVTDGRISFLAPHHKFVHRNGNVVITAGHAFPYKCSQKVWDEIRRQMELAVSALGLDNCAFNADACVDGDRVSIIEVGGRCGATCIPELISICYGFDYYETIIKCAMGEEIELPEANACGEGIPCMAKLLMSPVDGKIERIDEMDTDAAAEIKLDYREGDEIEAMINGTTRIGQVIAKVDSEEEMDRIMSSVYSRIHVNGSSLEELWNL